jgi:ribosomal protein L11 methyltransferase
LTARVPDALEEEIAAVLGGGSLGVEIAPAGPGTSELRIYLGASDDAAAWRERASGVLAAHGLDGDASRLAIDPVPDERWVERWQASLDPIPLGNCFVVMPRDGVTLPDGRDPIRLVPGMAFGTGEHETTRLCAAALERQVEPGSHWLDLGTGTGVLAIVAARLGAARVLAVDTDPEAVAIASEVVASNAAADVVEVRAGSLEARQTERFDGVVANIQSSFFLANATLVAAAMREGGALLASGILEEDVQEIQASLGAAGLRVDERAFQGPWALLVAHRGAA